ncbi:SRPBCC domain-containing protein [Methylosinus sp. Sm6]|uniref:SRPBCC domain-containing protein n=1 Tax=Methylosinus sp. Sm6 TaxID=2866948 RepID=UPI001C99B999|nr:SRPBCC domain-containing protein [Methylosinus sp. Sm6]MBY6239943.1 SRPBCC domain-containing protein [Methylosinus sp. Sm6]
MSRRQIETKIEIDAPASRVWALLTDFERMPSWNPFIIAISGELREGGRLAVRIAPPGKAAMRFTPAILAARPNEELRWRGGVLLRGVLDGEHYFRLEPLDERRTRLTQGEIFSGLLAGLIGGMLPATAQGFEAMNAALKARAEAAE